MAIGSSTVQKRVMAMVVFAIMTVILVAVLLTVTPCLHWM
jgi:hypothetical protein